MHNNNKIFPQPEILMKKGGTYLPRNGDINININLGENLPTLKTTRKKLKLKRQKGYYKKIKDEEPLKKPDFVQLLSKSQLTQPNPIYTGNALRVSEIPRIFGGIPPKALAPSTYIIPTTISNPIRGTFQPEYKPETEEEKEKKKIELEKKRLN